MALITQSLTRLHFYLPITPSDGWASAIEFRSPRYTAKQLALGSSHLELRIGEVVENTLSAQNPSPRCKAMKLADLPKEVIDDFCQDERWRLDIDPGFDSKHEFWMVWRHFIDLPDETSFYEKTEEDLAEFLNFDGFDILLPVSRTHHSYIKLIRLILSDDSQTLSLFLHDSFHQEWFKDSWGARYGFLAVADRYQKFGCDFYLASYYHFSYLINQDYEAAKRIIAEKGN